MFGSRRLEDQLNDVCSALNAGDREGAEAKMARPRKKAPDAPERLLAEAMLARFDDDLSAAAGWLRAALEKAPDWGPPRVELAALKLEEGDYDEARRLAESALNHSGTDDVEVLVRARLLLAEIAMNDEPTATRAHLGALLDLDVSDPFVLLRAGVLYEAIGADEQAIEALRKAVGLDPAYEDGLFTLASMLEAAGDEEGLVESWLSIRRLDLAQRRPRWRLKDKAVEALVRKTIGQLPGRFGAQLRELSVHVSELPSEAQLRVRVHPRQSVLIHGSPPDGLFLFARNVERPCTDRSEFEDELRFALLSELGNHFEVDPEELGASDF